MLQMQDAMAAMRSKDFAVSDMGSLCFSTPNSTEPLAGEQGKEGKTKDVNSFL
jgi:hypothetical protein